MTDINWVLQKIETINERLGEIDKIRVMLNSIREQQKEQIESLERLTDSIIRLAVIEERQTAMNLQLMTLQSDNAKSFDRMFSKIDAIESRVDELEKKEQHNERIRWLVWSAVGIALTSVVTMIMKFIGLVP